MLKTPEKCNKNDPISFAASHEGRVEEWEILYPLHLPSRGSAESFTKEKIRSKSSCASQE
jgi:hypothetical protein